jgi:hypothetical protein
MGRIARVLKLRNEVEAGIMKAALEGRGIPHAIRTFHDSAYDGLYQMQSGWGVIEADEAHRAAIEEIGRDLLQGGRSD